MLKEMIVTTENYEEVISSMNEFFEKTNGNVKELSCLDFKDKKRRKESTGVSEVVGVSAFVHRCFLGETPVSIETAPIIGISGFSIGYTNCCVYRNAVVRIYPNKMVVLSPSDIHKVTDVTVFFPIEKSKEDELLLVQKSDIFHTNEHIWWAHDFEAECFTENWMRGEYKDLFNEIFNSFEKVFKENYLNIIGSQDTSFDLGSFGCESRVITGSVINKKQCSIDDIKNSKGSHNLHFELSLLEEENPFKIEGPNLASVVYSIFTKIVDTDEEDEDNEEDTDY